MPPTPTTQRGRFSPNASGPRSAPTCGLAVLVDLHDGSRLINLEDRHPHSPPFPRCHPGPLAGIGRSMLGISRLSGIPLATGKFLRQPEPFTRLAQVGAEVGHAAILCPAGWSLHSKFHKSWGNFSPSPMPPNNNDGRMGPIQPLTQAGRDRPLTRTRLGVLDYVHGRDDRRHFRDLHRFSPPSVGRPRRGSPGRTAHGREILSDAIYLSDREIPEAGALCSATTYYQQRT